MNREDSNRIETAEDDKLVGVPSHPVATGVGAVLGGAAAGAAAGSFGGPVGAVVGAAVGALAGGLGGDAIANSIDQAAEATYWRENYENRPYVSKDTHYDDYEPAYALGVFAFGQYPGRTFDEVEPELSEGWASRRDKSRLEWEQARDASRDAWDRLAKAGAVPPHI